MNVKQALSNMILAKALKCEIIHLTKVKHGVGAVKMTIGGDGACGFSIWAYTNTCPSGEIVCRSVRPESLAQYLVDFCGRGFLKTELPLHAYTNGR